MIVRKATYDDIVPLYHSFVPYAQESYQMKRRPIDRDTCIESMFNIINADNFETRLVEVDGNIAAFGLGYFAVSWWKEPDASIDLFYVVREYRGSKASRLLLASLIDAFTTHSCGYLYAGAESGISDKNAKMYENLYKKFGFHNLGGGRLIKDLRGD